MSDIEQILLNRVKLIEDDSWSLLGSPNILIKELEVLIANQVREARIDEIKFFAGEGLDYIDASRQELLDRIKELGE